MHTRWRIKSYTPWSVHSVVMLVEAPLCTYSLCIHVGNILCAGPARCKFVGAIVMAVVVVVLLVAQPGRISALKCQFRDNNKEHQSVIIIPKLTFLGYVNVRLQSWPKFFVLCCVISPLRQQEESRNLIQTFLANSVQCSCSGWSTEYVKKLSSSQAQLGQATCLAVA